MTHPSRAVAGVCLGLSTVWMAVSCCTRTRTRTARTCREIGQELVPVVSLRPAIVAAVQPAVAAVAAGGAAGGQRRGEGGAQGAGVGRPYAGRALTVDGWAVVLQEGRGSYRQRGLHIEGEGEGDAPPHHQLLLLLCVVSAAAGGCGSCCVVASLGWLGQVADRQLWGGMEDSGRGVKGKPRER